MITVVSSELLKWIEALKVRLQSVPKLRREGWPMHIDVLVKWNVKTKIKFIKNKNVLHAYKSILTPSNFISPKYHLV